MKLFEVVIYVSKGTEVDKTEHVCVGTYSDAKENAVSEDTMLDFDELIGHVIDELDVDPDDLIRLAMKLKDSKNEIT